MRPWKAKGSESGRVQRADLRSQGVRGAFEGDGWPPAVSTAVEGSDATSPRDRVAATPGTGGRGQGQSPEAGREGGGHSDARGRWRQGGRREAVGLLPCVDAARRAWRRLRCECAVRGGAAWLRFRPGQRGGRTGRSTLCSRRLGPARPSRAPCRLQEGPASHSGLSLGRVSRSCEMAPAVPQFAVRRVRSVSVRLLSDAFDAFQRRSQMLTHLSSDCGVSVVS